MAEPFLGQISIFAFGYAPANWAPCAGQLMPIRQYTALYSILGNMYGGDGLSTFALPDLRGVAVYGAGIGSGSPNVGTVTGSETVTLNASQLAAHTHTLNAISTLGTATAAGNNLLAATGQASRTGFTGYKRYSTGGTTGQMSGSSLSPTGGGGPHNNMQPYIAMSYCIALMGIYPQRS